MSIGLFKTVLAIPAVYVLTERSEEASLVLDDQYSQMGHLDLKSSPTAKVFLEAH